MKRKLLFGGSFLAVLAALIAVASWPSTPQATGQAAAELVIYTGENFTGRSLIVQGTVLDLPVEIDPDESLFNWNDQVKSVVVRSGTWRLYEHGRLNTKLDDTELEELDVRTKEPILGWSAVVSATSAGERRIANLADAGIGMGISSIELVSATALPDWSESLRGK